jgi:hypothetical protein
MPPDRPLVRAAALGVACSVAFGAGLAFDTYLWGKDRLIARAVLQANDLQRLIDTIGHSYAQTAQYEELSRVTSLTDVAQLKEKYRSAALRNLEIYETELAKLPDERRRTLLAVHKEMADQLRKRLDVSP